MINWHFQWVRYGVSCTQAITSQWVWSPDLLQQSVISQLRTSSGKFRSRRSRPPVQFERLLLFLSLWSSTRIARSIFLSFTASSYWVVSCGITRARQTFAGRTAAKKAEKKSAGRRVAVQWRAVTVAEKRCVLRESLVNFLGNIWWLASGHDSWLRQIADLFSYQQQC